MQVNISLPHSAFWVRSWVKGIAIGPCGREICDRVTNHSNIKSEQKRDGQSLSVIAVWASIWSLNYDLKLLNSFKTYVNLWRWVILSKYFLVRLFRSFGALGRYCRLRFDRSGFWGLSGTLLWGLHDESLDFGLWAIGVLASKGQGWADVAAQVCVRSSLKTV